MPHRNSALADQRTSSLDIRRTPLSVRSIGARRPSPVSPADRVRGEFAEMRGFSPTLEQAARLFGLPCDEAKQVLGALVRDGCVTQCEDGRYRRTD